MLVSFPFFFMVCCMYWLTSSVSKTDKFKEKSPFQCTWCTKGYGCQNVGLRSTAQCWNIGKRKDICNKCNRRVGLECSNTCAKECCDSPCKYFMYISLCCVQKLRGVSCRLWMHCPSIRYFQWKYGNHHPHDNRWKWWRKSVLIIKTKISLPIFNLPRGHCCIHKRIDIDWLKSYYFYSHLFPFHPKRDELLKILFTKWEWISCNISSIHPELLGHSTVSHLLVLCHHPWGVDLPFLF